MVRRDALRRHLLALAPGAEVFLTLRAEFAKSLAVFSACGYVLGLGDRHLDNFLFDAGDGGLVGIDFGMTFGCGARAERSGSERASGVERHVPCSARWC